MPKKVTAKLLKSLIIYRKNKKIRTGPFFKFPIPTSISELDILSEIVWGQKIVLGSVSVGVLGKEKNGSCSYEFATFYNSYGDNRFAKSFPSYELNRIFCATIFGELSCGGIGGKAYGQTKVFSYRHGLALKSMEKDLRSPNKKKPREIFVRLATKYGIKIDEAK